MNILFHISSISERGGTLSRIRLAESNIVHLQNKSFIACPNDKVEDEEVLTAINKKFETCIYSSTDELDCFIRDKGIDLLYYSVHGQKESLPSEICPTFVHAVFSTRHRFGTLFASISPWLNCHNRTDYPVLPLIVPTFSGSTKSLRGELGIPEDALVFGGLDGQNSFNIPFAKQAIVQVAKMEKNAYFLFMNFEEFCDSPNVIFLPKNTDLVYKEEFINTCDAMLHARGDGETFGMSCAEFSVKNKPVVSWRPGVFYYSLFAYFYALRRLRFTRYLPTVLWGIRPLDSYAMAHLDILGEKAITYTTKADLIHILTHFSEYINNTNYDCYSEQFSADKVMRIFKGLLESYGQEKADQSLDKLNRANKYGKYKTLSDVGNRLKKLIRREK